MRYPISMNIKLGCYLFGKIWKGKHRFPMVLMLEPTHLCNLRCKGCGRVREYSNPKEHSLSLEQCIDAAKQTKAPVISICGGEPLIYPYIDELVSELRKMGHIIYLCTNALGLYEHLDKLKPSRLLFINIHIDGMEATHDSIVCRPGVFKNAIDMVKEAKARGFQVCTNTTVYKDTSIEELNELFALLSSLKTDGILVSPGYPYEVIDEKDIFLKRDEIHNKFRGLAKIASKYRVMNTPPYLRFLRGEKELPCSPWGCPTRNLDGWKGPCYVITDKYYESYQELMENTNWPYFERREDPRCAHCKMHSGFEPSVSVGSGVSFLEKIEMIFWSIF